MTDQQFINLSRDLRDAEAELERARDERERIRHCLRCLSQLADSLRWSSFGLVVPGSGVGTGLDAVKAWPTHAEAVDAFRRAHELESRVAKLQTELAAERAKL